jgi:hypothetical protein
MAKISYHPDCIQINAPEWFKDEGWQQWLNTDGCATWHKKGESPQEYSDVFFHYSSPQDCSAWPSLVGHPGIPDHIFKELVALLEERGFAHKEVLIWVTNLEED